MLDTRIPGRDHQSGDEGAKPLDDPDRRIIPEAQMAVGRASACADRSSTWAVVASQVPVAGSSSRSRWGRWSTPRMPSGYRVIDGNAGVHRRVGRLPGAARPPGEALEGRQGSAVVVSGDVHSNWASLDRRPDRGAGGRRRPGHHRRQRDGDG